VNFENWYDENLKTMLKEHNLHSALEWAWQAAQDEQANVIANQIEMLKRLRDERDALLTYAGVLVDGDFGSVGWSNEMDRASTRLRQLVKKCARITVTFEEWAEENNLSEYGKACSRAAWQAAQEAEREKLTKEKDWLLEMIRFCEQQIAERKNRELP
jgi:hypothetical protein